MLLLRVTGLIVLPLVATTLQASARPVPKPPEIPAGQRRPASVPGSTPAKVGQRSEKHELILVLSPNTTVWQEAGAGRLPDGGGPPQAVDALAEQGRCRPWIVFESRRRAPATPEPERREVTRACLASRYPHAPPA